MNETIIMLGWIGIYGVMALGAIGSIIGCAVAGQAAIGAMMDIESGYGKFVGVSAMPCRWRAWRRPPGPAGRTEWSDPP
jgi:V/A-type H+-transporting ATPase subunit K